MADIYRKTSLERLSNPEQLDKMIKITSPLSWLALLAVLAIVAVTVVWSIFGTLPTVETVSGVIVHTEHADAIYSDATGVLESFYTEAGAAIVKGDKIAKIRLSDGTEKDVCAIRDGVLSVLTSEVGAPVLVGTEIARVTPKGMGDLVVVCYVPLAYAQKFEKGMEVLVYPTSVDSQKYGHMEAEIVAVDEYATNVSSLSYVLGSGNLVAEQFAANGPVVSVLCKIKTDSATKSGFYWSNKSAKNLTVSDETIVSAKIVVDECAPIKKLIGKFQDEMEG